MNKSKGKKKQWLNLFSGLDEQQEKINTTVIGILESTINDLQVELMAEGIAFRKRPPRWYFLTSVSSIDISDGSVVTLFLSQYSSLRVIEGKIV